MEKAIRFDVKVMSNRKTLIHTTFNDGSDKWEMFSLTTYGVWTMRTETRVSKFTYSLTYDKASKKWIDIRKQADGGAGRAEE